MEMENPWLELPPCPPYVLPKDRPHIEAFNGKLGPDQAAFRIDLSLIPVPFMGNPEAKLVLLTRNPKFVQDELQAKRDPDYVARFAGISKAVERHRPSSGCWSAFTTRLPPTIGNGCSETCFTTLRSLMISQGVF